MTDNEKTVTLEHVAGIPVRHPLLVAAGRHYGLTLHTCVPFDPESKGGSEATVRIAKADLVPTSASRFAEGDLLAIVEHRAAGDSITAVVVAEEEYSAQPGTSAWATFGTQNPTGPLTRDADGPDGEVC